MSLRRLAAALLERVRQVARIRAHARQRPQPETPGDEFQNRRRVVRGVIHGTLARQRRYDDRRHPAPGSPVVPNRRRNVIPESAVLVIGHDDRDFGPELLVVTDSRDDFGDVRIARHYIGVAGMLVQLPNRLVESYLWQGAVVDVSEEVFSVPQVLRAIGAAGRESREIVERLVMRLEVGLLRVVDKRAIRQRLIPASGIPGPGNALLRKRVPYRLE